MAVNELKSEPFWGGRCSIKPFVVAAITSYDSPKFYSLKSLISFEHPARHSAQAFRFLSDLSIITDRADLDDDFLKLSFSDVYTFSTK